MRYLYCLFLFGVLLFISFNGSFASNIKESKVKKIYFGKYDEHAFVIYEQTRKFPKKNNLLSAVSVEMKPSVQCDYKFVFTMPLAIPDIVIWSIGSWYKLAQGKQSSFAIGTKSATHRLNGNVYSISGSVSTGIKGGFIRGVLKGGTLSLGKYDLDIYIDNELIKSIRFSVYPPFSRHFR